MSEALAEGVAAGDATDATVTEDAPVVEAPPAAPAYDPTEDPRVLDLVRSQASQIADERLQALIAQAQRDADQPQPLSPDGLVDEYGNINGTALAQFLAQRDERLFGQIDQRFQQIAQPLEARAQAETAAEGEQRIQDMIADDISRNGDFPTDPETGKSPAKDLVRPLSEILFNDVAQSYGATPRAAEIAVQKATALIRQVVDVSGKAAVAALENRNASLLNANREVGPGTPGVETRPNTVYKRGELVSKYAANANALLSGN